jgi:hypothetical protein
VKDSHIHLEKFDLFRRGESGLTVKKACPPGSINGGLQAVDFTR